jgi:hypothetical protein
MSQETALSQLQALEVAYNQGSANRRTGTQYPAIAVPSPIMPQPPSVPPYTDNGMLRQSPNPTVIPSQLPRGLSDRTGVSPVATKQYSPTSLPNPQIPLGNRLSNAGTGLGAALDKAGNAAAVASLALNTGASLANAIKNPDSNSLSKAAVTSVSTGLLLVPNPYAKAAGLVLSVIGEPIVNALFPSKNNLAIKTGSSAIGGQSVGTLYDVTFEVFSSDISLGTFVLKGLVGAIGDVTKVLNSSGGLQSATFNLPTGAGVIEVIAFGGNSFLTHAVRTVDIRRNDGQLDTTNQPYIPLVFNDGLALPNLGFDPNQIGESINRLNELKDSVNGLSDANREILDQLRNLASPKVGNPLQQAPKPQASPNTSNGAPLPSVAPPDSKAKPKDDDKESLVDKLKKLAPNSTPQTPSAPVGSSAKLHEQAKEATDKQALKDAKNATQTSPDRFRDPKDCQFSCDNLAKCFVDLKVLIFDSCNPDTGVAKTKEITIQVLPKDKAKTQASFKELLDMRSRECDLSDRVQTTPEYWAVRRGQIPQAIILYKTTTKGADGKPDYYQMQIPHYNGGEKSKPKLPTYQKGEHMAIYECIDGSQMQVYASSEAEALRVINACEKYINPRMRMKDKKNIKTGKRGGMAKVTVKPIRLDFCSTGHAKKAADWSVPL